MSLTRLLLVAVSSKKYIEGEKNSRIVIAPQKRQISSGNDPYAGEVILCFQLDERSDKKKRVARSLGIAEKDQRCDGLIFYAQDGTEDKVICLVEMKGENIEQVANQIVATRNTIKQLLQAECDPHCHTEFSHIRWKACFYYRGTPASDVRSIEKQLRDAGFNEVKHCTDADYDVGPFVHGEESATVIGKRLKPGKR
jgi:hypothetical protein